MRQIEKLEITNKTASYLVLFIRNKIETVESFRGIDIISYRFFVISIYKLLYVAENQYKKYLFSHYFLLVHHLVQYCWTVFFLFFWSSQIYRPSLD